jgi:hypothetical protein
VKEADTHERVIRVLENHLGRSGKDNNPNECVNFIDFNQFFFAGRKSILFSFNKLTLFETEETA